MLLSRLECSNDVHITIDHIVTHQHKHYIRLKVHSTQRDWTSGDGVDGYKYSWDAITKEDSDLQIEFPAQIQENKIVHSLPFTGCQLTTIHRYNPCAPLQSKEHSSVDSPVCLPMRQKKVLRIQVEYLPPLVKVESINQDMANSLAKATTQLGPIESTVLLCYVPHIYSGFR